MDEDTENEIQQKAEVNDKDKEEHKDDEMDDTSS